MADTFSYDVKMTGNLANLDAIAELWHYKILRKYIAAAQQTDEQSQIDAPVGLTGDLKSSGTVGDMIDNGPGDFSIEVSFGDGNSGPITYDYPISAATTQYPADSLEADGYAWFQELGWTSVAGNHIPAVGYLGSNFDIAVLDLELALDGLLDK